MSGEGETPWTAVPPGWPRCAAAALSAFTVEAANAANAAANTYRQRLAELTAGEHPTALVHAWSPNVAPSPTDLYLLTLAGHHVSFRAGRDLLDPATAQGGAVARALANVRDDTDLRMSGPQDLVSMEDLFGAVDAALTGTANKGHAAAFVCSRMRPRLFPVGVARYGTGHGADSERARRTWWLLMRAATGDQRVRSALTAVTRAVPATRSWAEIAVLEACMALPGG